MEIIFLSHPTFLGSESMPRFSKMLSNGMTERGHKIQVWLPEPTFFNLSNIKFFKKWLGYIDQFIVFPSQIKKRLKNCGDDVLFVFTDHALGPWVPLLSDRAHVIHCHDFLAQKSSLNKIKENPTGLTGKLYQKFIWRGYTKGQNFISVSNKTNKDLHEFLVFKPLFSGVVYNGLNRSFQNFSQTEAREIFGKTTGIELNKGYIMHVGGNQWYKNRLGVIEIYEAWRNKGNLTLPLLLIGKNATPQLKKKKDLSLYSDDIFFLTNVTDEQLKLAYAGARLLLFPSLAEGFGWPIAEAMASGCPVITTGEDPMREVGAEAAFFIPRKPGTPESISVWAEKAAEVVDKVVNLSTTELSAVIKAGVMNSMRFDTETALNRIEEIYKMILKNYRSRT